MNKNIKLIYQYMLTGEETPLVVLLLDRNGLLFADKYFSGQVRKDMEDLIDKHMDLFRIHCGADEWSRDDSTKGCFRRVEEILYGKKQKRFNYFDGGRK